MGFRPTGDLGPWTFYTDKRGTPVWFIKAPPTKPPTDRQLHIQGMMAEFARNWTSLPKETKMNWERASKRTSLKLTGYNLYQWWRWRKNRRVIETIEKQSGITLVS